LPKGLGHIGKKIGSRSLSWEIVWAYPHKLCANGKEESVTPTFFYCPTWQGCWTVRSTIFSENKMREKDRLSSVFFFFISLLL
jgi:hypothetical protein